MLGFVLVMNSYEQPRTDIAMGIPIPVLILIAVVLAMSVLAASTASAATSSPWAAAARAPSLPASTRGGMIVLVFALMGLLCGLASIVITARLNAGASVTGTMTELNVIAAAVIGGTSLAGGVGTIYGGLVGALIMQSLESGMILMGVPTPTQKMVLALVLVARRLGRHDLPPAAADMTPNPSSSSAASPRPSAACTPSRTSAST